ncbi:MAG: MBL fold metallo-hydrolase [Promethearchaeota archaeon]
MPNLDCNIYMLKIPSPQTDGRAKDGAGNIDIDNSNAVTVDNSAASNGNSYNYNDYELVLIDSGNGLNTENLFKGIRKLGLNPANITKIILTHEHLDHSLGVFKILNRPEINKEKIKVYALGDTFEALKYGDEEKIAPRALGIGPEVFRVSVEPIPSNILVELHEGDLIDLDIFKFKAYFTPGHSLGSVTLYEPDLKIMFPGDVVFSSGSFGRYDFPGGSLSKLIESIERLSELDVKYLCPGHMHYSNRGNSEIKLALKIIKNMY